ncbi:MAG: calcium/sodium antiporter, partial [Oscillospiraceae bacterium]|nr:calcium/sodium antiporter [Oscillospiraceae bacterium]
MSILLQFLLLILGFAMLIKGADWFVDGVAGIAERFGIPQIVIGLTIVAMGTSAPEAAVSINAALSGSADITIGNVVGSNIFNVLVILGITSIIKSIPVKKGTVKVEIPFMIGISVVLLVMGMISERLGLICGIILWALFLCYLAYLFFTAKKNRQESVPAPKGRSIPVLILLSVLGGALVVFGSDLTVDSATAIAKHFGMTERFIALTIVAFGTSLPELVTSITAAIKGKTDIAVGNIVGSNIFNILFVLGTSCLITPVLFQRGFLIDTAVAL